MDDHITLAAWLESKLNPITLVWSVKTSTYNIIIILPTDMNDETTEPKIKQKLGVKVGSRSFLTYWRRDQQITWILPDDKHIVWKAGPATR